MEELPRWQWFEVKFFLGLPPGTELETDPAKFHKWLLETTVFVDGLYVRPAALTVPSE